MSFRVSVVLMRSTPGAGANDEGACGRVAARYDFFDFVLKSPLIDMLAESCSGSRPLGTTIARLQVDAPDG